MKKICALFLAAACLFAAGRPWDKEPAAWSDADVAHLLNDSPWAVSTEAILADPANQAEPTAVALPPSNLPNRSPSSPGPGLRWDGGVGRNRRGHLPTIPVLVRWDSAAVVARALEREHASSASSTSTAAGPYCITIMGLIPAGRYHKTVQPSIRSTSDGARDARNPEELLEALMSSSRLQPHGSPEIHPENVTLDAPTGVVHIFFPRAKPIELRNKEVLFRTQFGTLTLETKFRLAAMKVNGKLEL
jgi:hypothetical protein